MIKILLPSLNELREIQTEKEAQIHLFKYITFNNYIKVKFIIRVRHYMGYMNQNNL